MISQKFKIALKLNSRPAYIIAQEAGISPDTLSKLMRGIIKPREKDERIIRVGQILGLKPADCFEGAGK